MSNLLETKLNEIKARACVLPNGNRLEVSDSRVTAELLRLVEVLRRQRDYLIVTAHPDSATKAQIQAHRNELNQAAFEAMEGKP